jgi:hypothetical protein
MSVSEITDFFITPLPLGITQPDRHVCRYGRFLKGSLLTAFPQSQCFRLASLTRKNAMFAAYLANAILHFLMLF